MQSQLCQQDLPPVLLLLLQQQVCCVTPKHCQQPLNQPLQLWLAAVGLIL
jgi:hypothetical protein